MNKLKLSVGVLAFVGLATLNFTQSESSFVTKAYAEKSDSISFSEVVSIAWDASVYIITSTSPKAALISSIFSNKDYDCKTRSCTVYDFVIGKGLVPFSGIEGYCGSGNVKTWSDCVLNPCAPVFCEY